LAAFSNGLTNLYYSDGLGVPHEDVNEQVRQANQKLIAAANKAIPHLKPSASSDLPAPWQAVFHVRTDSGNLVAAASGEDFQNEAVDFDHAIEMEPTNAMAYSNRGSAYSRLQDIENALANYDLAIKHNPEYPTAYANRAFAYYKVGRYEEGLADCNRAVALKPNQAYGYSNRGLCRAALGDKEGARADFRKALEIKPKGSATVIREALTGLHALDHPGEPLPAWTSMWLEPFET
jgi:tetratricopeptide (TPR) repeat protein